MDDRRPRQRPDVTRPYPDREYSVNRQLQTETEPWVTEAEWWRRFPKKAAEAVLWLVIGNIAMAICLRVWEWLDLHVQVHGWSVW